MSDYLANLAARSLNLAQVIQLRPMALFEPPRVTDRPVARPDLVLEAMESERTAGMPVDFPLPSRPVASRQPESLSDVVLPNISSAVPPPAILPLSPLQAEPNHPTPVLEPMAILPSVTRMPKRVEPSIANSLESERTEVVQPREPRRIPQSEIDLPVATQTQKQASPDAAQPASPRVQRPAAPDNTTPPAPGRGEPPSRPQVALAQTPVMQSENPSLSLRPLSKSRDALVSPPTDSVPPSISPGVAQEWNAPHPQAREVRTALPSHQPEPQAVPERIVARPHVTLSQSPEPKQPPARVDQPVSPPEPVVHVTIGRIEVRATPPPGARREAPARQPALGLQEYLQRYGGKR